MKKNILWIFRGGAFLLLLLLAAKPVVVRPDPGGPEKWAVLLDNSGSMRVKDPEQRLEKAKSAAASIAKKFSQAAVFSFSDTIAALDKETLAKTSPSGARTDMAGAIKATLSGNDYKAGVLLTDGRHVGDGDPVSEAAAAGRPLFLVGFGDSSLFKDIAVKSIQSPPFAFKNVPTSLSATLSVIGFPGKDVTVRLKEGDTVLSVQNIQVAGNDIETTVTFSWTPRSLGSKVLTVEASQFAGEVTMVNNRKDATLDVGRDKFRVLYLCGQPGYEYGFLRHQFKADPAVELVTFVILRNANNAINVSDSELSLIPFPTQDILIGQINTFDLVVFEEFAYQQYGLAPNLLFAIRQKVQEGGSFLLIGGPVSLGDGSLYQIPGFADMIPVEFGNANGRMSDELLAFKAKALSHPILRLEENAERNRAIWENMPKLDGAFLVPSAKPGATVLGTVESNGREHPVLAVWKYGKGRVATLNSRTTWRWSMVSGRKEQNSYVYQEFWKNMVLWLTHSDEFKSVRVALENKSVKQGNSDSLRVWVYDEYFKPISDVDVRGQIVFPDGEKQNLELHSETTGVFVAPFKGTQLGAHTADVWVTRKGKRFGEDHLRFRVVESHLEDEDLRPDFSLLKELARATGGKFLTHDEFTPSALDEFNREISKKIGKKVLLWNSPWLFFIVAGLLIAEWTLRKRRGLP